MFLGKTKAGGRCPRQPFTAGQKRNGDEAERETNCRKPVSDDHSRITEGNHQTKTDGQRTTTAAVKSTK